MVRCCFKVFEDSEMMNQTMSQPVVSTEMIDDDELQQELNDLLATRVDSDMSSTPLRPQTDKIGKYKTYL